MDKRPVLMTAALAVVLGLAGCAPEPTATGPTETPTTSASSMPGSPAPSPSATPTPTPTPAAAWTGETAYDACVAFQREKSVADGFDPDGSQWNAYSPGAVQQNGAQWTVDLIGTVTGESGETFDGVFSCLVAGTPDAPEISEYAGG